MIVIKNTEARIHHIGKHCTLMPGINEIEENDWLEVEKLKASSEPLKALFASGTFVVVAVANKAGKADPESHAILSMKDKDALAMVKETLDVKLLTAWKEKEERGQVLSAIERQIEMLNKKPGMKLGDE